MRWMPLRRIGGIVTRSCPQGIYSASGELDSLTYIGLRRNKTLTEEYGLGALSGAKRIANHAIIVA